MHSENVAIKVREMIQRLNSLIPDERITPAAKLEDDLGLDSIDILELSLAVEDEFNLNVSEDDLEKWITIGDVHAKVILAYA